MIQEVTTVSFYVSKRKKKKRKIVAIMTGANSLEAVFYLSYKLGLKDITSNLQENTEKC